MNKKIVIGIVTVIVLCLLGALLYFVINNNSKNNNANNNQNEVTENEENENNEEDNNMNNDNQETGSKTLVVYYSAQNHTEAVAEKIASNLGADLFEIVPEEEYTEDDLDWTDSNSRVSREHSDASKEMLHLLQP